MRRVNVYVDQPSCIELSVRETVRIDRLQPMAAGGYVAERLGPLLAADELAWPGHTHLCRLHSCRDTLTRMTRLARAAGIQEQRCLAGTQATCAAVAETIARGATALAHDGLLVVTFSGHTEWKHDQT